MPGTWRISFKTPLHSRIHPAFIRPSILEIVDELSRLRGAGLIINLAAAWLMARRDTIVGISDEKVVNLSRGGRGIFNNSSAYSREAFDRGEQMEFRENAISLVEGGREDCEASLATIIEVHGGFLTRHRAHQPRSIAWLGYGETR